MFSLTKVSAPVLKLLRYSRRLWVRVSLMAFLALAASGGAMLFEDFIPEALRQRFSPEAVLPVLSILATGMLAVSTFSLNVMVTAHHAAASQATPRAHRILLADPITQTVLATFIGAFVYALSAIILFRANLYAEGSAVMVMAVTVLVVVLVILAMLRWIDHLSNLGSMDATLRATEAETRSSLMQTRRAPALTATTMTADTVIADHARPVPAPRSGYLQVISLPRIATALPGPQAQVWLHERPGHFILKGQPIGYAAGLDDAQIIGVQKGLIIGEFRTFEQDATFGLLVLAEIASRALSPGINDPGTAIDVIATQEKLLWEWARTERGDAPPSYPQIFLPEIKPENLIESAYASIARDGAGMLEVQRRLLHALHALQDAPEARLAQAARAMADRARDYSESALVLKTEKTRMRRAHDKGRRVTPSP